MIRRHPISAENFSKSVLELPHHCGAEPEELLHQSPVDFHWVIELPFPNFAQSASRNDRQRERCSRTTSFPNGSRLPITYQSPLMTLQQHGSPVDPLEFSNAAEPQNFQ